MRATIASVLILLLGLTAQTIASARGAAAGQVMVVLCGPGGLTTVALDDLGQPKVHPQICPDGIANLTSTAQVAGQLPGPVWRQDWLVPQVAPVLLLRGRAVPPTARGPPVRV